jgi:SAM-dependent methyltransferase
MPYVYDGKFQEYASSSSVYSAKVVIDLIRPMFSPNSVLDIGCAVGTWLKEWGQAGVADYLGVDGDYINRDQLEIAPERFISVNLATPVDLGRRFDLVQSLEVGEHVPPSSADTFVDSIVRHAEKFVLFSAAPPGQGGEHHINEQSYEFWRERFKKRGFVPFDCVRPKILTDPKVSFWYRFNTIVYVRQQYVDTLPAEVSATRIKDNISIPEVSPLSFQLRKAIIRRLPYVVQNGLARAKARVLATGRF